ncbi:MAG TPA: ring-cleaving dioxygenase [Ktedonobacteraceae bacterium]
MQLGGLHHITAITGNASQNVAFYTQVLGMRLVKKTVNQDDVSAYHLFYGDEIGHAGTELTFFDWPEAGPTREGSGMISSMMLGVRGRAALDWWAERLSSFGVEHEEVRTRPEDGRAVLAFKDPEGQRLELLDDEGKISGAPWQKSPVPAEMAIRGLYGVRFTVKQLERTALLLTEVLGFRRTRSYQTPQQHEVIIFEVGPGGPGAEVHVEVRPELPFGRPAIGGVHHVAFRTPDEGEQEQWRAHIAEVGGRPTQIIDRFYFHSIYFREPGGILCEIATEGPGFATDEDPATLGESLALPPFLEPQRAEIEAGLKPIQPIEFATKA